jgi:PAS domain S-box-containing protein
MDFLQMITRKCSVPIYIISEPATPPFDMDNLETAVWTGLGGSMVSADKHGELVGEMANHILAGTPADSIPIVINTPTRLAVDWEQMQRFKLPLSALPADAGIFHKPQSFYDLYKREIIAGITILLALSGTILVLIINIVLRHRAERQNRELAVAAAQASEIIIMLNATGAVQYVNPALTRVTGKNVEELLGQPDLLESALGLNGCFSRIVESLKTKSTWAERLECPRPANSPLHLSLAASAVSDDAGNVTGYILIGRDVTREIRLEQQVRTAQKMEAVGLLAGGVAHDFNNLLQIISGHAYLALNTNASESEHRECLEQVLSASDRAAQLTRQLLAFGRRQPLQMQDTDLKEVLSQLLKMIRRIIGEQIEIEFVSDSAPENVRADRGQLEQVFVNLCVNARDAMPGGGQLTIVLQAVTLNNVFCEKNPWARPGRYMRVDLADTGVGMDKEMLTHIFEPFFTTKDKSKGMGLGLAVVHGIIQQHDGFVNVQSAPDRGTTFSIYLPVVERQNDVPPAGRETFKERRGTGTILLVEDEPGVLELAKTILLKANYRVLTAINGLEAVQTFQNHLAEIDLVLMDMVMPRLNGPEAYAKMAVIKPGVPVLFCSGYSADKLQSGLGPGEEQQIVLKPYHAGQLLERISLLLSRK